MRTAVVQTIDTGTTNTYSANIQPYQQVDLSFKSNGYLVSIRQVRDADGHIRNIDQGDYVTKGTVLATVQQDDYQQKLDQAKASWPARRPNMSAPSCRSTASRRCTRPARPPSRISTTAARRTRARRPRSTTPMPDRRSQAGARLLRLRAPFDSWVLKRNVDVGTLVGPATNGFTLADTRTVKAVFGVPDTAIGTDQAGQSADRHHGGAAQAVLRSRDRDLGRGRSQEPRVFGRGADRQSAKPAEVWNDRFDHASGRHRRRRSDGGADLARWCAAHRIPMDLRCL